MRLSGFTCSVVVVALVVTWALVLWLAPQETGRDGGGADAIQALDQESLLGIEAAQGGKVGRPRSLHAAVEAEPPARRPGMRRQVAIHRPGLGAPAGAHLLVRVRRGSRIRIHAEPGGETVAIAGDRTEFGSPTVLGVARAGRGWVGVSIPATPNGKLGWIRLDPERVSLGWTRRSIHVDLTQRQATLREHDRKLRSFTVTVGAPGTETPTGRFAVTDTFRGDLNPVYGCCAVALSAVQPDLPPGWPGGDRIAFHGNGTGQPLGIAASNGCLRAENRDVSALIDEIELGTPVFIR